MSLSSAISNALSGLTATTRGTEVVSTNIANKSVAGYSRRELDLSSRVYAGNGGGVNVDGVRRTVNAGLLADNRLARAAAARSDTVATFHATMEDAFGTADDTSSISSMVTALDAAITSASARPDNDIRLAGILDAAADLTGKINSVAETIKDARTSAEKSIARDVDRLTTALDRVATLNRQITVLSAQGEDASSLIDARQAEIDDIATIVPVQEVARENGRVALFTKTGATLLDGTTPARIEFSAVGALTTDMSVGNGSLATLSLNGKTLTTAEMTIFSGGSLAASFEIRDVIAPAYQTQIDAFARDLYTRFSDPAVDPSLAAGEAGIFTDNQSALLATNETGFANRIAVNARIDPAQGGDLWRIRAGVNATGSGNLGDATLIQNLSAALSDSRAPASAAMSSTARSMLTFASEISSVAASQRIRADASALQDQTRAESLQTALLSQGVDTDTEMEGLLSLERAYAANAKVFQTANDMLDQILRLT